MTAIPKINHHHSLNFFPFSSLHFLFNERKTLLLQNVLAKQIETKNETNSSTRFMPAGKDPDHAGWLKLRAREKMVIGQCYYLTNLQKKIDKPFYLRPNPHNPH